MIDSIVSADGIRSNVIISGELTSSFFLRKNPNLYPPPVSIYCPCTFCRLGMVDFLVVPLFFLLSIIGYLELIRKPVLCVKLLFVLKLLTSVFFIVLVTPLLLLLLLTSLVFVGEIKLMVDEFLYPLESFLEC